MEVKPGTWIKFISKNLRFFLVSLMLVLCLSWWFALPADLFGESYATTLYDRHGHLMGARIAADGQWRFPVNDKVPYKFREAILTFEDRYFYRHPGVNPVSLLRALKTNLTENRVKMGGSTLTMQVIRLSRGNPPRTIPEKILEILLAIRLELTSSKGEILSLYSAHAPFGGNVVGLEAASWRYYGKDPGLLSWAETATLAVLPNSPGLIYPGRNQQKLLDKRNRLLQSLEAAGIIDGQTLRLALAEGLPGKPLRLPDEAPHLLEYCIKTNRKSTSVHTTLDCHLQQQAGDLLMEKMPSFKANHIFNGAILIAGTRTGEVLAYIGNTFGSEPDKGYSVDIIRAPRSPGSVLKPLLYAAMLDAGELLPHSLVPDYPVAYKGYSPKNFNEDYDGAVRASSAIARSLNVPAVRLLKDYGNSRFYHLLKNAGLTTLNRSPDHYGLSLILGGGEATLWDLVKIYSSAGRNLLPFQDDAIHNPHLHFTPEDGAKEPGPIAGPAACWFMMEAMANVSRPEDELNWRYFASTRKIAWKTGTSYGHRDGWALGVTPDHTIGVWIGNASGEGRPNLTGINTAGPVMLDLFRYIPASGWFEKPSEDMETIEVCAESGQRAGEYCTPEESHVPAAGTKTTACRYHRLIHLDEKGEFQVTADCAEPSRMKHLPWFVLPPAMEWYYSRKHASYKPAPPVMPGCGPAGSPMDIIYPGIDSEILVPVNLDGSQSSAVFEAAHRTRGTEIYWHIDNQYAGSTRGHHRLPVQPLPGPHILTLVDQHGNRITRKFKVIGSVREN